jgi:hypothetical protein
MNLHDAISVIESTAGFTDEDTPVGEAWATVLAWINPTPVPVSERPWEREGWVNGDDECWIGYPSTTYAIADTGDYDTTAYEWRLEAPPSRPEVSNCVALPFRALPIPTPLREND